jgi:hypothetical protein
VLYTTTGRKPVKIRIAICIAAVLLTPLVSGPCYAQRCIPDTVQYVTNEKDKPTTYTFVSGAVYAELPVEINELSTFEEMFTPWIAKGDQLFVCGDHTLLHVLDDSKQCHVGVECTTGFSYYLIAVKCLRRCFAVRQR